MEQIQVPRTEFVAAVEMAHAIPDDVDPDRAERVRRRAWAILAESAIRARRETLCVVTLAAGLALAVVGVAVDAAVALAVAAVVLLAALAMVAAWFMEWQA